MSNPVQQAAEDKVLYSTDTVHRLVLYSRGCMSREGIWVPAPPTTSLSSDTVHWLMIRSFCDCRVLGRVSLIHSLILQGCG